MNIQLYMLKKNFDVQKALRFFKERRIKVLLVDLSKHQMGKRELELFAQSGGAASLINRSLTAVKEHPIAYTSDRDTILSYLSEHPEFLVTPLIRDGRRAMVGFDEQTLLAWLKEQ